MTNNSFEFPNPENSDKQGLLAVGGDLSPQRLLEAYRQGIFPWFESGQLPLWWSPDPRLILRPASFKLSRSLKQSLKKSHRFTVDTAFSEVINACASSKDRINRTWITNEMQQAYITLHTMGYAHSFEIWNENTLVGGLYGLSLGRAFFGESMFHRTRDSSKLAMYYLCQTLQNWQFDFIDCQLPTAHLQSLGAITISRRHFLGLLQKTLEHPTCKGQWTNSIDEWMARD
ncbi:Leucyl/phenylalanyl-tRNA--protein transferase [Legionella clemsonensis]|uniref:Leucyl/phenylalanyl-tRNA--protein transferase n=1 Tax=Legionella clemsonensis TaxID=1867846 RepID=A0A222P0N0_9GAMM|nr:Leucyl/phenylalanyl-tRNA--protein transferase [Legionella clemsonensis]